MQLLPTRPRVLTFFARDFLSAPVSSSFKTVASERSSLPCLINSKLLPPPKLEGTLALFERPFFLLEGFWGQFTEIVT